MGQRWECPLCGKVITLFINVAEPPICSNPKQHSNKAIEMEHKKGKK